MFHDDRSRLIPNFQFPIFNLQIYSPSTPPIPNLNHLHTRTRRPPLRSGISPHHVRPTIFFVRFGRNLFCSGRFCGLAQHTVARLGHHDLDWCMARHCESLGIRALFFHTSHSSRFRSCGVIFHILMFWV